MTGKKISWDSNKILSICAICISLLTLVIFTYQTVLIKNQSHLSAMPYLAIETSTDQLGPNDYYHTASLENYGVGPAIIERMTIFHNNKSYDTDFISFLKDYALVSDSINVLQSSKIYGGLAIPANSTRSMFKIGRRPLQVDRFFKLQEKLMKEGFHFEIIYRSIYGDRWKITDNSVGPEEL